MIKIKIKMLETAMGSETGVFTEKYEEGREYMVTPSLAAAFIENRKAVQVKDIKPEPVETKPAPALETKPAPKKRGRPRKAATADE